MRIGPAFLQTFVSQVIQSAASICTGVIIARGLGPAGQGRYALFAAAIGLLSTVGAGGQFEGHVLTSAGSRSQGRVLLTRSALQALSAGMVVVLCKPMLGRWLDFEADGVLAALFMLVLGGEVLALLFRGINLGQHHITAYNLVTLVQKLSYLVLISAVLLIASRLTLYGVMAAWLVAVSVNVIPSGLWIWRRSHSVPLSWAAVSYRWANSLRRGLRALLTITLTLLLVRMDVYMIRPMLGVEAVGQISVAATLAEYLWYIPSILGSVLFASVAASRGPDTVTKICRASRTTIAILLPVALGLAIVGRSVVPLIYGRAFTAAGILFVLLLPGMFAISLHLVIDSYFAGSGFPPITYLAAAGAVVLKFGLNLAIVPRMGLVGAALATSVVYISLLTVKVAAFVRQVDVSLIHLLCPTRNDLTNTWIVLRSWLNRFREVPINVI